MRAYSGRLSRSLPLLIVLQPSMPIQFRCRYCQQLLGISRSRAGSQVDCPACGRSLRVPLEHGARAEANPHEVAASDPQLIQALEVLAAPVENSAKAGSSTESTTSRAPDSRTFSEQTLQEIASIAPPTHTAPPELRTSKPSANFRTLMFSFLVVASAFAAGYFFPHTHSAWKTSGNPPQPPRNPARQAIDIPGNAPQPAETRFSGTVLYQNAAGDLLPDAGALIIMTPQQNPTSLKMDARPLKEPPDHPAHKAIKAALAELQVLVTTTSADGTYSFPISESANLQLIAVSRHKSGLPNAETPDAVRKAIEEWFDSAPHLTGRLAATVTTVQLRNGLPTSAPAIIFRSQ